MPQELHFALINLTSPVDQSTRFGIRATLFAIFSIVLLPQLLSILEIHFLFFRMNFVKVLIPPCGVLDKEQVNGAVKPSKAYSKLMVVPIIKDTNILVKAKDPCVWWLAYHYEMAK